MSIYPEGLVTSCRLSFETSEQAAQKIYFPSHARVVRVRATVQKALAGTDAGTITVKNSAGATLGTISFPASTIVETEGSAAISNQLVSVNGYIQLVPAKTTAGGAVNVFVEWFSK